MSSIREVRDAFEKIIEQMRTEKYQLNDSIEKIRQQISREQKKLKKISSNLWSVCANGCDAETTAKNISESLGMQAELWISNLKETIKENEFSIAEYNIEEIKTSIDELENAILSVKEEAREIKEKLDENKPSSRETMIYEDAKNIIDSLLISEEEFEKSQNYSFLGMIFSKRKSLVKKTVDEFKGLTDKNPKDIISEYETQEAISNNIQTQLEELQSKYDSLESDINEQIEFSNKFNEHHAIIDTLSKILNSDELLKDFLFDKFERESINETTMQTYIDATGDATIPNEYNTSLAKIEMMKKMLESFEKDFRQASKVQSDLDSNISKIRKAANSKGYNSTNINVKKIHEDIDRMLQSNGIKRNWCNNSLSHINNYQTRSSTDLLTWVVLYNVLISDIASSNNFDQSGALLIFGEEIGRLSEMEGLNFDITSIDTSDLTLIGQNLNDLDLDSVTRNLSSFTDNISSQVSSISDDVSTITTDTSSSFSNSAIGSDF